MIWHQKQRGNHAIPDSSHGAWNSAALRVAAFVLSASLVMLCAYLIYVGSQSARDDAQSVSAGSTLPGHHTLIRPTAAPEPAKKHPGNAPDCPDTDCISVMVNGDLLFHPNLWNQFAGADTAASDGTAFDFDPLFAGMKPYVQSSDVAICEFETPIAQRGGPYSGYPVFAIPPEVVDSVASIGYQACTHATNHSWDQGLAGIQRLHDELATHGIVQTGSYLTQEESLQPLVIQSPTGGGKLGLVTGTVSLNGMVADQDWRIDRLRAPQEPEHQADIQRAVDKARKARSQGADIVAMAMHSLQEYLDYADSWQIAEAHELADTGAFDVIYGAGCHCVQPIEYYHGTWILYGLGNAVTVSAPQSRVVNNQGITARIQFAGHQGKAGSWRINRIDWVPVANERQGQYRWCPISSDHPQGICWSEAQDSAVRARISQVLYSMQADPNVVREWTLS
jgi:poly-gamma-glutamate synthesis protein (capsule biosynthesis protein)